MSFSGKTYCGERKRLLFALWILLSAAPADALGPQPGDVYREFYVAMTGSKDWRVTDPQPEHKGAFEFLPNSVLRLHVSTLAGARRAELVIDRWGGHPGTSGQRIRLNGRDWITLPQLTTTPAGADAPCYMSEDNPTVTVPVSDLKEGENTLEGTAGDQNLCSGGFGWGQWGWYGAVLRVYYEPSVPHTRGRIASPAVGRTLGEYPEVRVETSGEADRVDVLAWYEGPDEDGDGVFEGWHGAYHYTDLSHHVGTSTLAPHVVHWDTIWVPDQRPGAIKLIARIRNRDGVWFVTPAVEGLTLKRTGASVKLFRPRDVPQHYWVRAGARASSAVEVADVNGAAEAVVAVRTWNGYGERFTINGHPVEIAGANHNYAFSLRPVPAGVLRKGRNTIEFHSTTEHHGVEILWPGPALLVRYGRRPGEEGRFPVEITSDRDLGPDTPVEITVPAAVTHQRFRVVDERDGVALPWQLEPGGRLLVLLPRLVAGSTKRLTVYFGNSPGPAARRLVAVEDNVMHQGQPSLRIRTPRAMYVYHKEGGGFASIIDNDGHDWISFRPGGGSAGEYRGIPNLGECFHPGYTGAKGSRTTLESVGPVRVRFRSETADGRYAAIWDVYPSFARMTIERAGGPYWFLYEGTPGGKLDVPEDFWVTSTGARRSVADTWNGDLESPKWVYFADAKLDRALFLASHQDNTSNDQFWQMESNMTVWGFGREYRCCGKYLTAAPAQFTIGLLEARDYARASAEIGAALTLPKVVAGKVAAAEPAPGVN
jgi:hypothetical protein